MGTSMPDTITRPAIRFSIFTAADALARSDHGADPLPDDKILIAQYDGYCQQEWDRYQEAEYEAERAKWLATKCPDCEPGGTGEKCDDHWDGDDQ